MVGGLSWGYVGPSWGYVGVSWGQCGPILGLCWPILELCWPILGLCWPILGLCWPILRPMLAHLEAYVGPCWPILNHKIRKMGKSGKSTKHRKTQDILAVRGGRRLGRRPLSPTERRELPYGKDTARGPLAGIFGLTPLVGSAGPLGPPFNRSVGVKVTEWGPASEIYSLGFLEHICWNRRFFGEQVSSRKLLRRVFPKELLPISTCYFV